MGQRTNGSFGLAPAVEGGWRKGTNRPYLHLSDRVVEAHLKGEVHLGLYPLLSGDSCHWLAMDFDGPSAMLDALAVWPTRRGVILCPRDMNSPELHPCGRQGFM